MYKHFLSLLLFIGLTAITQQGQAQLIYFSDSFGTMYTVNISSGTCQISDLGQITFNGSPFSPTDIAFHPNGGLYATGGGGFYEINLSTLAASFIGNHNAPSDDFINSLVCDANGVIYAADTKLFTVNINTGNVTNLGDLPCESAGDLAFNDGELYLACSGNLLLKIDRDNTNNSEIIGSMNASGLFFGIVTFATECSDVQTFGTAGNGLYEITINSAATDFVCTLDGATEVYGAAMETDFIAADCEIILDLDSDDSSGALLSDFFTDILCGNLATRIADDDFEALATGLVIDSMVFDIAAGQADGNAEQLILETSGGMDIFGSGTDHIRLVNTAGVGNADIVHPLENIMYINTAMPYTPGVREVTVQLFAENGVQSDLATAFITMVPPEVFSVEIGPDTVLCEGESLSLMVDFEDAIAYEWSNGSIEASTEVSTSGLYTVTVTNDCGSTAEDDIQVDFIPPVDILDLGPDLVLCPGDSVLLDATLIDGVAYLWESGETSPMLKVKETGLYAVSVTAGCGIQTSDVFIEFQEVPVNVLFPADTIVCLGEIISLDATLDGALSYLWEDGSTEPLRRVDASGIYSVMIDFVCGQYFEEIIVTYNDYDFFVDLGVDTAFCFGDSIVLNADSPYALEYLWQDGTIAEQFVVKQTGNYALTISDGCTEESDQVFLQLISCCEVFVPNVFSPNFDGTNDDFLTFSNCDFPAFNLKVFNRWGAEVFQTNDQYRAWNGRFKGKDAQQGVYVWLMQYNDGVADQVLSGSVTLVK